jgi:hypothetical protein
LILVQARSSRNLDSLDYSDLLTLFRNQKQNFNRHIDDDENNNNRNAHVMLPRKLEQPLTTERRFFLFPTKRPNHRSRPSYGYGKKSHWDTFFGKK